MVQHRHVDGDSYWTLPGGAVEPGETPEEAVVREVYEETRLRGTVLRSLLSHLYAHGEETVFLVEVADTEVARLGEDPEERDRAHRVLSDVRWFHLDEVGNDVQVAKVRKALAS
jgi:8-oxo-dGTP pyrophosphatase MutT (NUDIX family)